MLQKSVVTIIENYAKRPTEMMAERYGGIMMILELMGIRARMVYGEHLGETDGTAAIHLKGKSLLFPVTLRAL